MNYLLKNKPQKKYDFKIVIASVVFVLLFTLSFFFPNFFRSNFYKIMDPLWAFGSRFISSSSYIGNFFIFKSSIIKENTKLQDELAALRLNKIDYEILLKENEILREQLGKAGEQNRIISNVLSKPPQSPYDTFVIDQGSDYGVKVGDKVYISDNIIIGQVFSVTNSTSLVKLFSSGDEEHEVILYRTGASFVVSGNGGANLKIEVPKETDIIWGDYVIYPGTRESVLATVYYVDSNSQSSFKTIHLRIPGNVFQTKSVFVEI